jgi:microsomal dipeptidase-like Zn-dependent dipeptidase
MKLFREKHLPREEYIKLPLKDRLIKLSKTEDERATKLHKDLISVDMVNLSVLHYDYDEYHGKKYPIDRVRNSGLTCLSETIEPLPDPLSTIREINQYVNFFERQTGINIAYSTDDIRKAKKEGKQVVWLSLEMDASQAIGLGIAPKDMGEGSLKFNTSPENKIYPSLANLEILHKLGVRRFSAIFNYRNYIGDGCLEISDSGLSYYGLAFIEKMNKVSMITDMSHWGEESSFDAIKASNKPLVISHAGARALVPKNRRLKSDELIIALAEAGGIVGVCGIPNYLAQTKRQGVKNMMDHIDHIVNLVGVDHVGIGTDNIFGDHAPLGAYYMKKMGMKIAAEYMEGIESLEEWPNIVRGLVLRGYSDQEIEKIIGGNALRVMDKVTK